MDLVSFIFKMRWNPKYIHYWDISIYVYMNTLKHMVRDGSGFSCKGIQLERWQE